MKHYHAAVCPVCGSPVIRYWYKDEKPDRPEIGIEGEQRPVACRICGYNYKVLKKGKNISRLRRCTWTN